MPPLMPDEDKNFGGSLVLDFGVMTSRENDIYSLFCTGRAISVCDY